MEDCLINLLNFYNYSFNSHDEIIKSICKRFTNIRQFIRFLNSLAKIPKDFNDFKKELNIPLGVEYNYVVIQSIKFFDYDTYLKIYNDRDLFLDNMEQDLPEFLCKKYKKYSDLIEIIFSNTENTRDSLLNPTLFKMCFLDINKTIQEALNLLDEIKLIQSNHKQMLKLNNYLNLNIFASKYDIILALSPFKIISYYKNIDFKTRELLWNLFSKCTSHNGNPLLINPNEEYKSVTDIEIQKILLSIFYNFNKK